MAGLYQRVGARPFPSRVAEGYTGEGALESQGGPTDPAHGQNTTAVGRFTTTLGFAPEAPAVPEVPMLPAAFGLAGGSNPDETPTGGHAAPRPGWAGSYAPSEDLDNVHANSNQIHSEDFGALANRVRSRGAQGREPNWQGEQYEYTGDSNLQPLTGQIRAMGGYDTTQGYDLRNGHGFDAGHRQRVVDSQPQPMVYLDPAERIQVWPQGSGSFTPTDAVQSAGWASGWDAGAVNSTPPTTYTPPAGPATAPAPPVGAPVSAGWFS